MVQGGGWMDSFTKITEISLLLQSWIAPKLELAPPLDSESYVNAPD